MNKFYVFPQSPNDIYHYGIKRKSGRYPFGSGERPYQSVNGGGVISGYFRERARKKKEAAAAKAGAQQTRTAEQESAEKDRILREGSATEVMSLRGKVTNQELQQAVTRLNLEAQLKNMSAKEFQSTMSKIDNVMKDVKMGAEWAKIGIDTYNTMAKIYNTTDEGKKDPWPMVGEGKKDK